MGGFTAWLRRRRGIAVRATTFSLAAATIGGAVVAGDALRHTSRQVTAVVPEQAAEPKDQNRLAARHDVAAHPEGRRPDNGASPGDPRSDTGSPDVQNGWRDHEFIFVQVVDGRSFRAGTMTIRLTGIDLPHADQVCRTLDNRLEQCVARAATQLELLTRSRAVACRYRMVTTSEAIGACRVGASDLAARMIRTGHVQRSAEPEETAATAMPQS
jgi:endonuclease YncB( thermonuclease family)